MQFDFFTIYQSLAFIDIFISLLLLFYIFISLEKSQIILWFFIGKILEALSLMAIGARTFLPEFVSVGLANSALLWGVAFQMVSLISYKGEFKKPLSYLLPAIGILGSLPFLLLQLEAQSRVVISMTSILIITGISIRELIKERHGLKITLYLAVGWSIYLFMILLRLLSVLSTDAQLYNPLQMDTVGIMFVISTMFAIILSSFGFLLLLIEYSQKMLREIEEMRNVSFEQSPVSIVITDLSHRIKYVNRKFEEISGYSQVELLGKPMRIMGSGLTPRSVYEEFRAKMKNGEAWEGEFINRKKNGELFYEKAVIAPLRNTQGQKQAYIGFKNDISVQKRLAEELKINEEKYKLITENVSDVMWVYNLTLDKFVFISKAVERERGYTVEEAMQQKYYDSMVQHFAEMIASLMPSRLDEFINDPENAKHYFDEIQQPCKNGKFIWVEASTKLKYNQLQEIELIGLSRNIEARKKIEQELRKSKQNLKEAQMVGNVGHWDFEIEKNYVYWSEQTYQIFEISPQSIQLDLNKLLNLIHPDDRKATLKAYNEAVKQRIPLEFTHRIITPGAKSNT